MLRNNVGICTCDNKHIMHINLCVNLAVSLSVTLTDKVTAVTDKATMAVGTETNAN